MASIKKRDRSEHRVVGMLSQLPDKHLTCTPEYECVANIPVVDKV